MPAKKDFPGILIKRGNIWHYQVYVKGKGLQKRSTKKCDYNQALAVARQLYEMAQLLSDTQNGLPTLDAAIERQLARLEDTVSDQQAERAGWAYLSFQRWIGKNVPITTITKDTLTKYQTFRLGLCARQTVEKEINFLRAMLKSEGMIVEKPLMPHGKSTPGRPFNQQELKVFFESCAEYPHTAPGCYTHIWLFLLSTGARPAELIPSTRKAKHIPFLKKEIDLQSGTVLIRGAKRKAGDRQKISRIPVDITLLEMCLERAPDGPHVFSPMHIAQLFDNILDHARKMQEKSEVPESERIQKIDALGEKLTAHSFRHTFGTLLAESGASAFVIQNILRHSDPRMTSRYLERARPQVDVIDITAYMPHRIPEQVELLPEAAEK